LHYWIFAEIRAEMCAFKLRLVYNASEGKNKQGPRERSPSYARRPSKPKSGL
jgi:hypothetical protein